MTLPWYKTRDLVSHEIDITRQKTDSLLDRLAREARLHKEQMQQWELQNKQRQAKLVTNMVLSRQRASAADEIDEANRKLKILGVQAQIPISESSIKQQIMSGRTWVDSMVRQTEIDTEQARMDDLRKEAEKWAKWELKQAGGNWANLNPDDQEASMEHWFNKLLTPKAEVEEVEPTQPTTPLPSAEFGQIPGLERPITPEEPVQGIPPEVAQNLTTTITITPQDIDLQLGGYDASGNWTLDRPALNVTISPDLNTGEFLILGKENEKVGTVDVETGNLEFDDSLYLHKAMVMSPQDYTYLEKRNYFVSPPSGIKAAVIDIRNWLWSPKQVGETTIPAPATILGLAGLAGSVILGGIVAYPTLRMVFTGGPIGNVITSLYKKVAIPKAELPKVPTHITTIRGIKDFQAFQNTAVYRDLLKWATEKGVTPAVSTKGFNTMQNQLFQAYQYHLAGDATKAQQLIDQLRFAGGRLPGAVPSARAVTSHTGAAGVTQAPPTTTLPSTPPTTPPAQVGGAIATQVAGVPPTIPPTAGVVAVTGVAFRPITTPVGKGYEILQDGQPVGEISYNPNVPGVTGIVIDRIDIVETARRQGLATQAIDKVLAEAETQNVPLYTGILEQDGVQLFNTLEQRGVVSLSPAPERMLGNVVTRGVPEAVKPTATTVKVTAETLALAEGGTVTGIIPEGVVTVEGLEPIKAIRNLQSQYATKKLTYEATKKQLIDYAKEHLPLEVRGKMLAAVKNVKTELDLTKAIAQADKYAEQAAQKTLRTKITNELRRITPKRQATGYRYGRFTAETQKALNQIKANTKLDREDAKAEILRNIEAAEDGKMTFEQADEANEILAVSGLKGMTSNELAYTLSEVKSLKETGRGLRAVEREAEIQRIEKLREDVISTITGGKGIKPGVGTIDTRDMWVRDTKIKSFLTYEQFGMDDVFDYISRLDKTSKPFQSPISQLGFNLHMSRSTQQMGVINWVDGKTADKVKGIYGVEGRRELNSFLGRLTSEKINLGKFANTEGQQATLTLTKDQIIQKYLEMQDPTLDETFRVGMKWTDEMMSAVKDSMTAEDLQYAAWLSNQYVSSYGKTIKPAFEAKYHIPFPENPNYVPINRDLEGSYYEHILTAQDNYRYAGVANNSLKARVRNRIPLRFNGATQVWVRHVVQMEHFKAFSQSMKEARMVFGNQDVRTAIRQYHGNDVLKHIDRHLDDIARDGIDRALIVSGVDKLRGHFTLAALGIKVAVSFKQALSLPAYLTYEPMPIKDFFTGVADFYKHPMANIREMKELSGYFSERWGRGHERDVRLVKEKDVAGRLSNAKNWRDLMMLGIHKVDTAVTQPGAWSVYQSMRKQGISKQEAITHAEVATKRSQPSFGMEDMAALRKHGSFGKLFTMFQSQPNKYYRLIADSARNLKAGRGSKKRNILNILLAWWVLPMMFQLVSDAFQWKKEHQVRVAILGPANYLLAAGQILQSAYGWITDEPFPAEASPVFSTLRQLQYAITGTVNLLEQGRDPLKDIDTDYLVRTIEHYAKAIGQVVGLPTPFIVQAERAIRNADIRQMIFSQYALKNEGDAVRALQDAYAQAYGYNKWSDLPEAQQERFWELRPDLK